MAAGTRTRGGRIGALLLAVHLAAGILLPLLHATDGPDHTPDHIEAAGTHHGGHADACVVCRYADSRFVGDRTLPSHAAGELEARPYAAAQQTLRARPFAGSAPARAPPRLIEPTEPTSLITS